MDDFDTKKIQEYNQYNPVTVQTDVTLDIKQNQIKLFYLDTEEVPRLLVVDENQQNIPPHNHVYIGTGCTDSYHSEDCSNEYRQAMDKAISYGKKYNHAIAKHFNLKLRQSSETKLTPTQEFIYGNSSNWDGVKIELSDIQALFGGRNILIDGSGYIFVQSVRPKQQGLEQKNYTFVLEKNEIKKILQTFIEQDFISLKDSREMAPPDQADPEIILTNSLGHKHSVTSWDPPLPGDNNSASNRFHAVYRTLLRLETKAIETCKPVNSAPYSNNN
ncbi:MAG: hypothetical protein KAJ62_08680 [Desulfobacteraceae bacterium]|nr:hypothetical protein [Desulfobacteraceae bacterium]